MDFKKGLMGILLIACLFLSVSAIGAAEDSNHLVNDTNDALTVAEEDNLEVSDNEILSAGEGSFSDLSGEISGKSEYKLERNYTFNEQTDSRLTTGIDISSNIVIDGQGHTIDAKGNARIFRSIVYGNIDVTLKNIIFVNGYSADYGGAIYWYPDGGDTNIINCTFINNTANGSYNGGAAIYESEGISNIINCTFINNHDPKSGLVLSSTNVVNSIFLDDSDYAIFGSDIIADYNWFGATIDDYKTNTPKVSGVTVNNFYVLNFTLNHKEGFATIDLNNLYENGVLIDNYDDYALPPINFKVKGDGIQVVDNVTLDNDGKATIYYAPADVYSLTISCGDVKLKREVKPTFTMLKDSIDNEQSEVFNLEKNYEYDSDGDKTLLNGIEINKTITIDGHGHVIDAKGLSNIFYLNDDSNSKNLILKNIIFANANGTKGAAVYFKGNKIEIINCTFINNTAQSRGDAICIDGAVSNENEVTGSIFINNKGSNSVVYINLEDSSAELNLSNSIFIGNDAAVEVKGTDNVIADYNWWGNVDEDKTNVPNVDGATINSWFVLKITADTDTNIATVSLNNLFDGNVVRVYENYALPSINVNIEGTNVTVQKSTVTLDNEGRANTALKLLRPDAVLTATYEGIETDAEIHYVIVDDGSFKALNDIIRFSSENDVIELTKDYAYLDSDTITSGIQITKTLTVNGNNHIIDAKGKSGIFLINSPNVVFRNITFKNGIFDKGGAIYASQNADYLTVNNCTFINNTATNTDGGAIWSGSYYFGSIVNSTFINNTAVEDGAALFTYSYYEDAVIDRCLFINNSAPYSVFYAYYLYNFHDSIFLNNVGSKLISGRYASYGTIGNNWYGNTFDDYNSQPVQMAVYNYNWLYLNIKFNETHAIVSLNNLYTKSSGSSSVYSKYNLPEITLKVNSTTLNLETDAITLDSNGQAIVPYTMIGDEGALTVSYAGISLTKDRVLPEFGSLQTLIDNAEENSVIELTQNYTYNAEDEITKGIIINKNITIDGKGHTIDAKQMTRIFNVQALNVTFKNIIFVNGKSNLRNDDGGNHGGAIYYKLDNTQAVNFNVINCTLINNIADVDNYNMKYSGGAIFIKANEGSYNIEDCTFINNTAKDKGGAIYLNTKNAEFTLFNSTFTGNKAEHDGALYVETDGTDVTVDKCLFRGNEATAVGSYSNNGNAIIWKSINDSGNSVLKNSIILDNGYNKANTKYTFLLISGTVNIDGNWWGTTNENHPETLDYNFISGITPNSWLFIKSDVSSEKLNFNETSKVKYVLYSHDGTQISEFDNTLLPYVGFDVSCDKGGLDKDHVSLNEEFTYRLTEPGSALIRIYCNNIEFNTKIYGPYLALNVDTPFVMYANQNNLNINKLIKTYNGYYSHVTVTCNDSSILIIDKQSSNTYISAYSKGGSAKLIFSYDGYYSGYPDAEEFELDVNVFKVPLTINVTNIEGNEITLNVGDTLDLNIAFEIDAIHKGYAPAWDTLGFKCDPNIILFTYDKGERPENGSYYPTGHIVAKIGGTTNLTIYSDSPKFVFENYTLKITVNKIPTEIALDDDDSFNVDDISKLNATFLINGTPSTVPLIYESSDENVIQFISDVGDFKAVGNGTAVLTVRFAGNSTHENSSKTITVTVTKYETTTSITSEKELSIKIDDVSQISADLTCEDPSFEGTLNYESSDESVATVDSDGKITAVGEGSAIITVKYDGNYRYANSSDSVSVTVSKIDSSIILNTDNPLQINVFDESQIDAVLNHIGNLSYASSNPDVVAVNQTTGKITAKAGGMVNITVSYAGDNKYAKADVNLTVIVKKLPSHITVDDAISVDVDANNNIVATIDNGRTLRYVSVNPSIVTVNETTGVITGIIGGTANVTVIFDEDDQYLADAANVTVTVNKLQSTFTIEKPIIEMDVYGNALIIASSNNDGEITYASCDALIATVNGNNVTALKGGKVNITLSVAETDKFLTNATNVTVTVNKLQSTIVVADAINVDVDENKSLGATVDENRHLRYVSADSGIVTVNDEGEITGVIAGTAVVTVIFDEDDQYLGSEVNVTVVVKKLDTIISIENDEITIEVDGKQQIIASTNSDSPIIFFTTSPIISIGGTGMVTGVSNGTAEVTLYVAESDKYSANTSVVTVKVNKVPTSIAVNESISVTVDGETNINAALNHEGQLTFTSLDESIASVDAQGNIKAVKVGKTQIIVSFEENDKYLGNSVTVNVTVKRIDIPVNDTISMDLEDASRTPTFSIDLPNATGNFSVIVDGKEIGPVSLKNGKANITVPELAYGSHNVTVVYSGDDKYSPITQNATVNITKPVLSKNADVSMLYTANAKYTVCVTVGGKPIVGQYVTFKFNGKTYNVKTDKNGYAKFKLPSVKPKKAKYAITATFHGVTVKNNVKVNSIIKAKNLKIKKSKRVVKVKVSLKKVNGKYLKGKRLKLKIKGKTLKAKTNKKGVATFKVKKNVLKKLKVGKKYKYKVIYGKDVVTKKIKVKR